MITVSVWPVLGTTVTLASGFVITAAGAVALLDDEIAGLLSVGKLLGYDPTALNPNPSPIPPSGQGGAITAPSQAAASAATGLTNNALVVTQGNVAPADVAGGTFFLDVSSSATIDGGLTLAASGGVGRIRRIRDRSFINVKWFGAKGDGTTDDTAAFQAAIDAASGLMAPAIYPGCDVYIPPGNYIITDTLKMWRSRGCENIRVYGADTAGTYVTSTQLFWRGMSYDPLDASTKKPMFWLAGNDFTLENFAIKSSSFLNLYSGVEVGSISASAIAITHNKFFGLAVVGTSLSHIANGITVGSIYPQDGNLENMVFEDCQFDSIGMATGVTDNNGVWIVSGQPINSSFFRCHFTDSLPGARGMHGVTNYAPSATLTLNDCDFQSQEIGVGTAFCSVNIGISGGEAENCKKLFYGGGFGDATPGSVAIRNVRVSPTQIASTTRSFSSGDHYIIDQISGGGLSVENCFFIASPSFTPAPLLRVNQGAPLSVRNCDFQNMAPFNVQYFGGTVTAGIYATANRGYNGGTVPVPMPSYLGGVNPGGTANIVGTATTATVTLPASEQDTSYNVRLFVESITSGGVVGALWADTKTASGFNINVSTAPTSGKTLVVRYELYR